MAACACALLLAPGACGVQQPGAQHTAQTNATGGALPRSGSGAPPELRRGLWVLCEGTGRVLEHPQRIAELLNDAAALGVSDLFVQVYRGGRAWFATELADAAPYADTLDAAGNSGLARLLKAARARGLRVHAWVNVLSLAQNRKAPLLDALGPGVVLVDHKGRSLLDYPNFEPPAPDRAWYRMGTPALWLDPAVPELGEHLGELFAGLLRAHPELDGLHFDYIRYADALPFTPGSRFGVGLSFGYGKAARARFREETGLAAPFGARQENNNAFDDWRRAQLSALVAELARRARAVRPGIEVSAAVIADRERAYLVDMQDWLGWLDAGALDFAVPMLYTRDAKRLRYGIETLSGLAGPGRKLLVGLGAWLFADRPEAFAAQLRLARQAGKIGSALFSWDSIREQPALLEALAEEVSRERVASPR